MKNRRGSVLALTLMIFASLMILGMFTLSLAVNENKQAMYHQNKKRAYYIARSGAVAVEAAILDIKEEEERVRLLDNMPKDIQVDNMEFESGNLEYVKLKTENDKLIIESKADVQNIKQIVSKILDIETGRKTIELNLDYSMFALGDIKIEGGTINGDFGCNGNIEINGWPNINNKHKAYLREGSKIHRSQKGMAPGLEVVEGLSEQTYDVPVIQNPPLNNSIENFYLDYNQGNDCIKTNKNYNEFKITENKSLEIDTRKGNITIIVNKFDVHGNIKIIGDGELNLIILDTFNYKGEFNKDGNYENLNIFYYGDDTFEWPNNGSSIKTSLYIYKSDLAIKSGDLEGNIFSKGELVTITNEGGNFNAAVYAPSANIDVEGGNLKGAIVGNNILVKNHGPEITYDSSYAQNVTVPIEGSENGRIIFKPGYFK